MYRLSPNARHLITLVTLASPDHRGIDEANELEGYLKATPDDPLLRRIDLFHVNFLNEASTLLHNLGGGQFDDTTVGAGLDAIGRTTTGFGALAFDAENDGLLDVFIANGHNDDRPWVYHPMAKCPTFYRAKSPGRFELAPPSIGPYFWTKTDDRKPLADFRNFTY